MTSWLPWTDSDGNRGEVRLLVVYGLTASLLSQDILPEAEAYITTDHKAFYTKEYKLQVKQGRAAHPNYKDEKFRQDFFQVYPHSQGPLLTPRCQTIWVEQWPLPSFKQ